MSKISTLTPKSKLAYYDFEKSLMTPPDMKVLRNAPAHDDKYIPIAAGVPRIVSRTRASGLALAANITNLFLNSNDLTKNNWVKNTIGIGAKSNHAGIAMTYVKGEASAEDPGGTIPYYHTVFQRATIPLFKPWCYSFLAKRGVSPVAVAHLEVNTGVYKTKFYLDNGTFDNAADNTRYHNRIRYIGDGVYECSVFDSVGLTATPSTFAMGVQLNAGRCSLNNYPVAEGQDIDGIYIGCASLTSATSYYDLTPPYIDTTVSAVTMTAESYSALPPINTDNGVIDMVIDGYGMIKIVVLDQDFTISLDAPTNKIQIRIVDNNDGTSRITVSSNGLDQYIVDAPPTPGLTIATATEGTNCIIRSISIT